MENNVVDLGKLKTSIGEVTERVVEIEHPRETLQAMADFAAGLQLAASEIHEGLMPRTQSQDATDEARRQADLLDEIASDINRILTSPLSDKC